jgi:hypothetical protein
MQVGFDEPHLVEPETSGRSISEAKRFAREIDAYHDPISTRQIQAHLAGTTSDIHDARISGDRPVNQPQKFTALGACSQPTEAGARRIVGERRPLIKAAHNLGSRLDPQS